MVVNSCQVKKLVVKTDPFSFKFQKFLLRMPSFLLGIFILFFFSYSDYLDCIISLHFFSSFSFSSQLYSGIDNQFGIKK